MTDITKKDRKHYWICKLISLLLNFGPVIYFVITAFIQGDAKQKLTIGGVAMLTIILTIIMQLFKYKLNRTIFWLLCASIYIALGQFGTALIIIGVCNVLDEIIVEPLSKHFKNSYKTNKLIDKRM